jgi:adenylate cyclase
VNLASRLEGANKFYGSGIIASEATVQLAGDGFAWRELDAVRVKGRTQALKIYELLALASQLTEAQRKSMSHYAEGLTHWRARDFAAAAASFGRSAETDRPAALLRDRARELIASPPSADWHPVRTLQEK